MDGNNEKCFSEGKKCKDQERLKMRERKFMLAQGRCFSMEWATLSGPVAVSGRGLLLLREIQWGRGGAGR